MTTADSQKEKIMKTLTKNGKRTMKNAKNAKTAKPVKNGLPDRLAVYKELAASRLKAMREFNRQMRDAERRLDRITGVVNELKNRCFDGNITPNDLANKLAYLGDDLNEAWGKVYEARIELADECRIVAEDVARFLPKCSEPPVTV
jgi:ArsR family metal-binding transcriptional regulator